MKAPWITVNRNPAQPGKWTAYCHNCKDGINAGRIKAENWREEHLREVHDGPDGE